MTSPIQSNSQLSGSTSSTTLRLPVHNSSSSFSHHQQQQQQKSLHHTTNSSSQPISSTYVQHIKMPSTSSPSTNSVNFNINSKLLNYQGSPFQNQEPGFKSVLNDIYRPQSQQKGAYPEYQANRRTANSTNQNKN